LGAQTVAPKWTCFKVTCCKFRRLVASWKKDPPVLDFEGELALARDQGWNASYEQFRKSIYILRANSQHSSLAQVISNKSHLVC
jgi:hypothetical protein